MQYFEYQLVMKSIIAGEEIWIYAYYPKQIGQLFERWA